MVHGPERIASIILSLLQTRADTATICPSEVARQLEPVSWRPLMPEVRRVATIMAAAGEVELRQRGVVVSPFTEIRGPLRISLARRIDLDGAAVQRPP